MRVLKYMLKSRLDRILLRRKNIFLDSKSTVNYSVINTGMASVKPVRIINSQIELKEVNEGVFIEHVVGYGDIYLDRFVSISGPGTILHSVQGSIKIGAFTSIAQNVSIQEFNHNYNTPTSFAINYGIYDRHFTEDVFSKGNIIIEEDVWVGSNVTILTGVCIGRGSIIGAGSVVTKSIPKYSMVFGNPAKFYKKRFSKDVIELLEEIEWWMWDIEKIRRNEIFFNTNLNLKNIKIIKESIVS